MWYTNKSHQHPQTACYTPHTCINSYSWENTEKQETVKIVIGNGTDYMYMYEVKMFMMTKCDINTYQC